MSNCTNVRKVAKPSGIEVELDDNVKAELPPSCKVVSAGIDPWTQTFQILTRLADGTLKAFFKKEASGSQAYELMKGTYDAESALYSFIPEQVQKPLAWGSCRSRPDTHFYLCEFVDTSNEVPSASAWADTVASLHRKSMGKSPGGRFGFHVNTHLGNIPINNTWSDSWEAFWTQQMTSLLDREEELRGPDREFSDLKSALYSKVIPRLLRPLETGGRSIQPCLIHSNLFPGNIKRNLEADELCMFDSGAYWGHNEADLGVCRNHRHGYLLEEPVLKEYSKQIPMSEPEEDFDDRNALYALKFHVLLSILRSNTAGFRRIAIDEMRRLVKKFPDGCE